MPAALKQAVEVLLAHGGPAAVVRGRQRGRVLILAYHDILPDGERPPGDRSLHLPQRRFAAQLDELVRRLDVVPLAQALEPPRGSRPRAVITFDDAYRGALTAGVDELARRGLPATMFVAPAFLGGRTFWWDDLAIEGAGLSDAVRRHALEDCRGEDPAVRAWAAVAGVRLAAGQPECARVAGEAELSAAVARAGMTLGSHTWSHPNLSRLAPEELSGELVRPLEWLRARFGSSVVPWLSYPYGLESAAVRRAVAAAGYDGALRVTGGWLRPNAADAYALPRLNVPAGMSADGFALRAAGIWCR
jgi:peptidoglycan/xylan/chitin deacetylase (PgdA/CDA1 family)